MFEMISRIYQIAGSSRKKITVGILCNILKSFFQSFMMLSVFLIMLSLDTLTSSIVLKAVTIILISILGRFFFQWMSDRTMSGTGYDIFRDYRLEIGERLKQAPMGYFSERTDDQWCCHGIPYVFHDVLFQPDNRDTKYDRLSNWPDSITPGQTAGRRTFANLSGCPRKSG